MRLRDVRITSVALLAVFSSGVSAQFDQTRSERLPNRIEPELASSDFAIILSVRGMLTGARTFDIPVDASLTSLHVSPSPMPAELIANLVRPNGSGAVEGDPDVKYGVLRPVGSRSITPRLVEIVTRPQPGLWRLQLSASADGKPVEYSVVVFGHSQVEFQSFDFVRYGGDGVHGGFMAMPGSPVFGAPSVGEARISDQPEHPTFHTVDEEGTVLQTLGLSDDDWVKRHFIGPVPLPSVPFAVVMRGTDASGATVQRRSPETFRGQPVDVKFKIDGPSMNSLFPMPPGSSRKLTFSVRNTGPAARFVVTAQLRHGTARDISPQTIVLGSGASAIGMFAVDVPMTAKKGDLVDVGLVATNAADDTIHNSAWQTLEVSSLDDVDGDYKPNASDNCPEFPNSDQLDLNGNGIGDRCESTLVWPTTTLGPPPPGVYPGPDFVVPTATDSDGSIQVTSLRGPCIHVSGTTFRPTGVGICVIRAMTTPTAKYEWSLAMLTIPIVPRQ